MSWPDTLQAYNAQRAPKRPVDAAQEKLRAEEKEQEVQSELRKLYAAEAEKRRAHRAAVRRQRAEQRAQQRQAQPERQGASLREIPRFYVQRTTSPAPPEPDPPAEGEDPAAAPAAPRSSLPTQVRRESRTRYLENRAEQLLDDRELAMLWDAIQANSVDAQTSAPNAPAAPSSSTALSPPPAASPSHIGGASAAAFEVEKRLHYDGFLRISSTLPPAKAARYFKPSLFLSFPQDGQGRISSRALWRLVSKKIQLTRLRISLTCYDDIGYGYLREQDLENYVYDQLGSLPPLSSVERDFYPYYVFTAVRKFIFTLDTARRGKLRIRDIVHSPVMLEFDALRYPHGHVQATTRKSGWFSANHTQEVYAVYLGLDSNQNGMLSREEFRQYNGGSLTNIFIDGLYSEYRMYPSAGEEGGEGGGGADSASSSSSAPAPPAELEMDYKTFLDFVLAMEYKQSPSSISYFFKILDAKHVGYLDADQLQYWFRAVNEKMAALEHEQVNAQNEIFDMVCPAVPGRITLADLISSKCGHTVISILIDVNGFWKYDNRENLMHTETDNEDN